MFLMMENGLVAQQTHCTWDCVIFLLRPWDCAALKDFLLCLSFHCSNLIHCDFVLER